MNRIAKILSIASALSQPQYFYQTDGSRILLITRSPDFSSLKPLKDKAKEYEGHQVRSPAKLPSAFRGVWYEMPNATEAEALGFALRDEFKAKPMK